MTTVNKKYDKQTICLLLLMLLAGCLYIFHPFLFGNETLTFADSGSDTMQQYLMWYNGIATRLREGTFSFWDFRNGLGVNEFNLNLTEPFLVLLYLFGAACGPEKIAGALVYMQILKILLSGLFCYLFLSEFRYREPAKLLPSFIYGFNGYLMIWGQHYQMGTIVVLLPLLLLYTERFIRNAGRAFLGISAVCMVIILSGYYQGYMTMLGVGIYLTGRVLLYEDGTIAQRIRKLLGLAGSMVLGVVMGAVNLLPSLGSVSSSTRLESETTALTRFIHDLKPWNAGYYKGLVYRIFGNNLLGTPGSYFGESNYYEEINLFFSTLLIVLLAQYPLLLIRQKKPFRQKLAQITGLAFMAFMILIKAGSLIFNGFVYAFSRHTFLLMPFFALLCAYVLQELLQGAGASLTGLVPAGLALAAVYARAYMVNPRPQCRSSIMVLLLTGLAMLPALFCMGGRRMKTAGSRSGTFCSQAARQTCAVAFLCVITAVNLLSDTALCYRDRDSLKKDDAAYFEELYTGDTVRAVNWIKQQDDSFYRIDKDYYETGSRLESLAQDYAGMMTYNSTQNKYIKTMITRLWPNQLEGINYAHTNFGNAVHEQTVASLGGIKYILSHDEALGISGYELLHQEGNVCIYRNTGTDTIAKFFTRTMPASRFNKANGSLDTWDLLPSVLLTAGTAQFALSEEEIQTYREVTAPEILDRDRLTVPLIEDKTRGLMLDDVQELTIPVDTQAAARFGHITAELEISTNQSDGMSIYVDEKHPIYYYNVASHIRRIELPDGCSRIVIRTDSADTRIHVQNLQFTVSNRDRSFSDEAEITVKRPDHDSYVSGSIQAKTDGYLMLAIPYQEGWTVRVDGQTAEMIRADYGYMAVPVQAGEHRFEAVFKPPMLRQGILVSAVSLLLWIILAVYKPRRLRNNEKTR